MTMRLTALLIPFVMLTGSALAAEDPLVERGRYLVKTSGCNDCHTAGYMQKLGDVPEQDWLLGDRIGWRGPWGTTYAINLRLYLQPLDESQWIAVVRNKPARPPMPWFNLRDMTDDDLRALYRYIRHLGPAGNSAPGFVPPGQEPSTPYIVMVPQTGEVTPATGKEGNEPGFFDWSFKPAKPRIQRP